VLFRRTGNQWRNLHWLLMFVDRYHSEKAAINVAHGPGEDVFCHHLDSDLHGRGPGAVH
jgi:hypothetical protein